MLKRLKEAFSNQNWAVMTKLIDTFKEGLKQEGMKASVRDKLLKECREIQNLADSLNEMVKEING